MIILEKLNQLRAHIPTTNDEAILLLDEIRQEVSRFQLREDELARYQLLLSRTTQIVSHSGLNPVAGNILEALMSVIGATRGFMGLVEADGWRFIQARNIDEGDLDNPESQISTRIIEESLLKGVVVMDDAMGRVASNSVPALRLRSVACFKMDLGDQVGFIYVDNPTQKGLFDRASVHAIGTWLPLLQNQLVRAIASTQDDPMIPGVLTRCTTLRESLGELKRVATFDVPVLLWGETGTGKSFIARKLHEASKRSGRPFVHVNCAALPGELAESELFGAEAGAFTGARQSRRGKFEAARGGTLFLDEIDLMSIDVQAKLLIAVQDRVVTPLGGNREIEVDVRIIAAMSTDPEDAISENRLREELYYRLATIETYIPPLRERPQDIPLLARNALEMARRQFELPEARLSSPALQQLLAHDWPGNVRELENTLDRAALLSRDGLIEHLQLRKRRRGGTASQEPPPARARRRYGVSGEEFLAHWEAEDGDIDRVAAKLGVSRRTVFRLKGKHIPEG